MKINSITSSYYMQNYRSNKITSDVNIRSGGGTDQVTLSDNVVSFSKTLSNIKDKLEIKNSDEKDRISNIKHLMQMGKYNIDSELVAEKILSHYRNR